MKASTSAIVRALGLLLAVVLPACGGGGGSAPPAPTPGLEQEPNGTSATAGTLLGGAATGTLATAGDVDYWEVDLTLNDVVEIEVFGTRLAQAAWDAATNVPRLTLYATDGVTKLQEHQYAAGALTPAWSHGRHDFGIPAFPVRATGTHFVAVRQDNPAAAGGAYALRVRTVTSSLRAPVQTETEARGATGGNDTSGTSQTVTAGTVLGHFAGTTTPDYYRIAMTSGQVLVAALTAYRNGVADGSAGYYDSELRLYSTDGTTLLKTADDGHFSDAILEYRVSATGDFFLSVFNDAGGNADYVLDLRVISIGAPVGEAESNDTIGAANSITIAGSAAGAIASAPDLDVFGFTGTAGKVMIVHLFDSSSWAGATDSVIAEFLDSTGAVIPGTLSAYPRTLRAVLPASGSTFVRISGNVTSYAFYLEDAETTTLEVEPNDATGTAMALPASARVIGTIDSAAPAESDLYSLTAAAGELVTVACFARMDGGFTGSNAFPSNSFPFGMQPLLRIRDGGGAVIATSTSTPANGVFTESTSDGSATCWIAFVAPSAGSYYVDVSDVRGATGTATGRRYLVQRR